MRVLLVATWGLPLLWRRARYRVPQFPGELCGRSTEIRPGEWVESYSSTATIRKALEGHEVKAVVVGMESVVDKCQRPSEAGDDKQRVDREVCERNEELFGKVQSVEEIRKAAEEVLRRYAELFLGEAEVLVAPAVGWYRSYRFVGSLDTARFFLLDEFYTLLNRHRPDVVVLDVTHGVNYLPLVASQALKTAAKALYLKQVSDKQPECLISLNSDPVAEDGAEAVLHVAEMTKFEEVTYNDLFTDLTFSQPAEVIPWRFLPDASSPAHRDPLKQQTAQLRNRLRATARKIADLAKALNLGLLLYFVTKYDETDMEEAVKEVSQLAEEVKRQALSAEVYRGGKIAVVRRVAAAPEVALLKMAAEVIYDVGTRLAECKWEDGFYRLSCLGQRAKELKVGMVAETLFGNEVDDLKNKLSNKEPHEPTLICELINKKDDTETECKPCAINRRILIAHASLNKTTTEVVKRQGELYVRLRKECLGEIERNL